MGVFPIETRNINGPINNPLEKKLPFWGTPGIKEGSTGKKEREYNNVNIIPLMLILIKNDIKKDFKKRFICEPPQYTDIH